ncbi:HAD family hydrolase [Burkholderia sp. Ac-20379]|uniref:HAD family hydrolase n=1 Tax=Burkholderia sp. Ac-20379 TaxID=2703900 RepID=UPI00197ECF3B|nr:HAD family hydrolase [Burkholderia sp. Ac-20379]MBN3723359.1 HAD family hydrolase [Burkholderia sp. Ac-20379]
MLLSNTEYRACALLFDMDGTLLDSHAATVRAYSAWAERRGLDPDFVLRESQGRRTRDALRALAPAGLDIDADIAAVTNQEREDTEGVVEIPGARALLSALPPNRWAIVTSADRILASNRIRAAGLPTPPILVTADDVAKGKPSPEGYLLAAERLGVDAHRCIVFEDAPAGIAAGLDAGARVVAIASRLMAGRLDRHPFLNDWRNVSAVMDDKELVFRIA